MIRSCNYYFCENSGYYNKTVKVKNKSEIVLTKLKRVN